MILGWGSTKKEKFDFRRKKRHVMKEKPLKEAHVRILPFSECKEMFEKHTEDYRDFVSKKEICATKIDTDACHGDSGGPLVLSERGRWFQVGIVSMGYGCADNRFPGIYTNVKDFLDWIRYNTDGEDAWSYDCNKLNAQ